ncbi:Transcription factor SRM1 [Phytophthora citrophthora]|uniref:Transcription factor SRM1 n=1 Tax=Phytophthora citrophthora TaxID=4793 RepID=A0AAD9LP34_9STRA|nr:Transcription factor SRM1 [Phytophthora citrophthora]
MTISTRIRGELFTTSSVEDVQELSPQLIRLPLTRPPDAPTTSTKKKTKKKTKKQASMKIRAADKLADDRQTSQRHGLPWTTNEHDLFLQGLELYPSGPWKAIAAFVGTRTPRQTMTHAQKYRQKIQRRRRGLLTSSRQPVPMTSEVYGGLVITTNANECTEEPAVASQSPTSVDKASDERMPPLENNWFDKVEMGELDAAFRAFLEGYDPTLFPMDEEMHNINAFNMEDGASIIL